MNFSTTLKNLRESRNVTQDQLAKYLKVSRPTVAGYETKSRQPDFERLVKLANYFDVSIDYLITGDEAHTDTPSPSHNISEKALDRDVLSVYGELSLDSKLRVKEYMDLLRLKEKTEETEETKK